MGLLVLVLLVVWPVTEIYVAVLVADQIGGGLTLLALMALSGLGVLVLRGSGRAWRTVAANAAPTAGSPLPPTGTGAAAADAGFRLLAGLLLLVPGFVTGAVGLLLLFPPVRALAIAATGSWIVRRFPTLRATMTRVRIVGAGGDVIPGTVVDPDQPPRRGDGESPPELH